jgi:acyl-CoA synthetase (NDP forming)
MSPRQSTALLEPQAIQLLQTHGIPYVRHGMARSADEAVEIAQQLGYPIVLKIVSPDVLHKSDAGGVAVGLQSASEVRQASERVLAAVIAHTPRADIQGMLVCQQAPPGLEVIVGALQDALFGPTVMFGMGGVFAEVLQDVSFRVTPLERHDAIEMIQEIRGFPLLTGARDRTPCDVEALADLLLAISEMVVARPDIRELDLNPVRVYDKGLAVLDVRILVQA